MHGVITHKVTDHIFTSRTILHGVTTYNVIIYILTSTKISIFQICISQIAGITVNGQLDRMWKVAAWHFNIPAFICKKLRKSWKIWERLASLPDWIQIMDLWITKQKCWLIDLWCLKTRWTWDWKVIRGWR